MLELDIPGWRTLRLDHLVLDLNGTVTLDAEILKGVQERLASLSNVLQLELLSADTLGRLDVIAARLGVRGHRLERGQPEARQKSLAVDVVAPSIQVAGRTATAIERSNKLALRVAAGSACARTSWCTRTWSSDPSWTTAQ